MSEDFSFGPGHRYRLLRGRYQLRNPGGRFPQARDEIGDYRFWQDEADQDGRPEDFSIPQLASYDDSRYGSGCSGVGRCRILDLYETDPALVELSNRIVAHGEGIGSPHHGVLTCLQLKKIRDVIWHCRQAYYGTILAGEISRNKGCGR